MTTWTYDSCAGAIVRSDPDCKGGPILCMEQECANFIGAAISCCLQAGEGPLLPDEVLEDGAVRYNSDGTGGVEIWDAIAMRFEPMPLTFVGMGFTLPDGRKVVMDGREIITDEENCTETVKETWLVKPPTADISCDAVWDCILNGTPEQIAALCQLISVIPMEVTDGDAPPVVPDPDPETPEDDEKGMGK